MSVRWTAEDRAILKHVATRIAGTEHSLVRSQIFERTVLADRTDANVMRKTTRRPER